MWEKTGDQQTQTTQEQTKKAWLFSPESNTTREIMVSLFEAKSIKTFTVPLHCTKNKVSNKGHFQDM